MKKLIRVEIINQYGRTKKTLTYNSTKDAENARKYYEQNQLAQVIVTDLTKYKNK